MNRVEALSVLALTDYSEPDGDDVADALDLQLHEVKKYWLTNPVFPLLFRKRLERVKKAFEAAEILGYTPQPGQSVSFPLPNLSDAELVKDYERVMSGLKTLLGRLQSFPDLEAWVEKTIAVQEIVEEKLWNRTIEHFGEPASWPEGFTDQLKVSDGMDTRIVAKALSAPDLLTDTGLRNDFLSEMARLNKKRSMKR